MAGIARCGCCGVIVVGVALGACHSRMKSSESVVGVQRVIESNRCPVAGCVARIACSRKACRYVAGIVCSSKVRLVAAVAGSWESCVVVIGVALSASDGGMCTSQGEHGRVIEG